MKYPIPMILLALGLSTVVHAEEREALIQGEDIEHGGFGGIVTKFSAIDDQSVVLTGGKGAWLINHSFYVGGAGYSVTNELDPDNQILAYGGPIVGYIGNPNKIVHYTLELQVGGGGLVESNNMNSDTHSHSHDTLMVVEPSAAVNFNLAKYATLSVGVSYRFIQGSEHEVLTDEKLSGASADLSILIGKF